MQASFRPRRQRAARRSRRRRSPVRPAARRCVRPRPARRRPGVRSRRAAPARGTPAAGRWGWRPRTSRPRASSCSWRQTSAIVFSRALAICAASSRSMTCAAVSCANTSSTMARSAARDVHPLGVRVEARVARQRGLQQHLLAEDLPLAFVLQAQHHGLAVAGGKRAVGVDGGVRGAGTRRRLGAVERVVQREAHPLDHRLQHRHVEPAAPPGAAALDQRGQDAAVGVHAGGDVGDRGAGLGRVRRACR